jgi:hypothetical protein
MRAASHIGDANVPNPLKERKVALEDEFFAKKDSEKIAAIKKNLNIDDARDALAKATGMTDEALLDRLVELGISGETVVALSLVPLIKVAWADGEIQLNERDAIMEGAKAKGIERDTPAYDTLKEWLESKPDDSLFEAWTSYVQTLCGEMTKEQTKILREQILTFAKVVADSAGGFLGIKRIAKSEDEALNEISAAFDV